MLFPVNDRLRERLDSPGYAREVDALGERLHYELIPAVPTEPHEAR
jgi:hypothetical protein